MNPEHISSNATDPLVVSSETLLRDHAEILIVHRGECYRLRRTRQDKLILTK